MCHVGLWLESETTYSLQRLLIVASVVGIDAANTTEKCSANLCVESHLRELLELGFEVIVVRDATAGPTTPEGDGYLAALINYRYIANGLWTTAQTVEILQAN